MSISSILKAQLAELVSTTVLRRQPQPLYKPPVKYNKTLQSKIYISVLTPSSFSAPACAAPPPADHSVPPVVELPPTFLWAQIASTTRPWRQ
jgi:hypothetical protein